MAREIVALSPDSLEIREVEDPVGDDGQVLIRSQQAAAKHGTETASVKGYGDRGRFDRELHLFLDADTPHRSEHPVGNMVVGTVEAVIVIYDLRTATKWRILEGHRAALSSLEFTESGAKLASYSARECCVWSWQGLPTGFVFLGAHDRSGFDHRQPPGCRRAVRIRILGRTRTDDRRRKDLIKTRLMLARGSSRVNHSSSSNSEAPARDPG